MKVIAVIRDYGMILGIISAQCRFKSHPQISVPVLTYGVSHIGGQSVLLVYITEPKIVAQHAPAFKLTYASRHRSQVYIMAAVLIGIKHITIAQSRIAGDITPITVETYVAWRCEITVKCNESTCGTQHNVPIRVGCDIPYLIA